MPTKIYVLVRFLSGILLASRKKFLILSQKQCFKFRDLFFYKDIFICHINLDELNKQNMVAFFVFVFKDMVV